MSEAEPTPPQPSVPLAEPPRNRLSIAQLMLWTLGSALILGGFRLFRQQPQPDTGRIDTILSVFYLAYSLPLGAQVGSVFLWVARRWRRQGGFPVQPGHWLLLVGGFAHLLSWTGYAIGHFAVRFFIFDESAWWLPIEIPALLVALVGYALTWANVRREQGIWRLAVTCLVVEYALILLMLAFAVIRPIQFQGTCCAPVCAVLLLLAGISDLANRSSERDYLHWTGIAATVTVCILQASLPLVMRWLMAL